MNLLGRRQRLTVYLPAQFAQCPLGVISMTSSDKPTLYSQKQHQRRVINYNQATATTSKSKEIPREAIYYIYLSCPLQIGKAETSNRVTLSIVQNHTLLTGLSCQQCVIDRENINQSEVRDSAAQSSISYTGCLLSFSNT